MKKLKSFKEMRVLIPIASARMGTSIVRIGKGIYFHNIQKGEGIDTQGLIWNMILERYEETIILNRKQQCYNYGIIKSKIKNTES